jgi:hypothetical protein
LLAGWSTWREAFSGSRLFSQSGVTLRQQFRGSLVIGDGIVKVTLHSGIVRLDILRLAGIVRLAGNRHVTRCTLGGIVRRCEQGVEGDGLGHGLSPDLSTGLSCGGCCGWSKLDGCASDCIRLLLSVDAVEGVLMRR